MCRFDSILHAVSRSSQCVIKRVKKSHSFRSKVSSFLLSVDTVVYSSHCLRQGGRVAVIDLFRGACAVKETSQLRVTSSVPTTEMLATHDISLGNVDGSLFHIQI